MIIRKVKVTEYEYQAPINYVAGATEPDIQFQLTDYEIPSGATGRVYVGRSDGTFEYTVATISGNNVTVAPTSSMFSVKGPGAIQVTLYVGNEVVKNFAVPVYVHADLADDSAEAGSDVTGVFRAAEEQALADFQEQAEEIAEEVKESIPADYTELTEEVSEINERLSNVKSAIEHTNGGFDVDIVGSEAAGTSKIRAIVGGFYKGQKVTVTNNGSDGNFIVNWYKPDGTRFAQTQIEHGSSETIVLTDLIDYVNIYNVNGTGINAHFYAEFLGDVIKDEIGSVMDVVKNVNNVAVNIATGTLMANTRLIMPYNVFSGQLYKVTNNADNTISFSFRETPSSQSTDVTTFNAGETKIIKASINGNYVSVWSNGTGSVSVEELQTVVDRYNVLADSAHIQGDELTWELGSIVSGVDSQSTTRVRCGYIEVTEGTRILVSGNQNSLAVVLYDADKEFLRSTGWSISNQYAVEAGTKYIRLLVRKSSSDDTISNDEIDSQGARCIIDLKLPKSTILLSYDNDDIKSIADNTYELESSIFENVPINLKWTVGGIKTDGSDDTWNARLRTQYIDVKYVSYITADVDDGYKWLYWFYDKNKNAMPFVSNISWQTTDQKFVVPNGVAYMRISFANTSNTAIPVSDGVHLKLTCNGKIGKLVADDYIEPMPEFFRTQVDTVISNCEADMLSTGRNGDSFMFITDVHWEGNFKHSPTIIREIARNTNVNIVCCTGDFIDRSTTSKDAEISAMQDCLTQFKNTGLPFFTTVGNHDRNSDGVIDTSLYLSAEELFAITQNPVSNQNIVYADMDRLCFYHDRPATKTRYIFVDSGYSNFNDYDVTNNEITWIRDVIEDAPIGWHFIVIVHSLGGYQDILSPVGSSNPFVYKQGAQAMLDELDTLHSNYSIEAVFVGHTHYDANDETTGGIPIVWTNSDTKWQYYGMEQPKDFTVDSQCFDVVTIDYAEKKIYLRRVGRGTDRVVSYGD